MRALFRKFRPAVSRYWLMLVAGVLWSGVGVGLCMTACAWFSGLDWPQNGWGVLVGFGTGIGAYRFGFSRLVRQNLERIATQPVRTCVFAFQAWRGYGLIVLMMALGVALRHSALPRLFLGMIYAAIGTGLTLSSALYYEAVFGQNDQL